MNFAGRIAADSKFTANLLGEETCVEPVVEGGSRGRSRLFFVAAMQPLHAPRQALPSRALQPKFRRGSMVRHPRLDRCRRVLTSRRNKEDCTQGLINCGAILVRITRVESPRHFRSKLYKPVPIWQSLCFPHLPVQCRSTVSSLDGRFALSLSRVQEFVTEVTHGNLSNFQSR